MIDLIYGLILTNVFSIALAAYLWRKSRAKPKSDSVDTNELLLDILSGDGLVRIQRIAPADVLIRSRRS